MEQILVIGGGALGGAVLGGTRGVKNVTVVEIDEDRRRELGEHYDAEVLPAIPSGIPSGTVVVVAVKPQQVGPVLNDLASRIDASTLIISVAAGITLDYMERVLDGSFPIVRAMPNIAARVGCAAVAICCSQAVLPPMKESARRVLESIGRVYEVDEKLMDAVTGLSGSGPAYVFLAVEALADAGVLMGLDRKLAVELATQTLEGAVALLRSTGDHPSQLRESVTSPGGTTAEGLFMLEKRGFRRSLIEAVRSAAEKSALISTQMTPPGITYPLD
jgi:pyrroline-5-carboxylate reductase